MKKIFLFFLLSSVVLRAYSQNPLEVKEVTMRDSYEALVKNNSKLFLENSKLKKEIADLDRQRNIYNERIKSAEQKANQAIAALEAAGTRETAISEKINEDFSKMQAEIGILTDEKEKLLNDKENDVYFKGWKEAQTDIEKLKIQLREVSAKNEARGLELSKTHYNLGNIFFQQGDMQKAVDEYKKTLEYNYKDSETYYNLAVIYDYHLKDSKIAGEYYEKYLEYSPDAKDKMAVNERLYDKILEQKLRKSREKTE
ncbi:MAG: tetratricopeptide repeat protein [Candidatus Omnitrophica bacterium]|nr:tetratricopeptide repeat protein [Candidatus Omnitrophota bacterium]MDD5080933.1 tetratricopeptide repeat protein [Candidatus Omnitrophota bacterium]MDD5441606.1 tetratricopeptide repeat protein [Candidatus Omnitrophota bacterium]